MSKPCCRKWLSPPETLGSFLADVTKACLKVTTRTLKALVHSLRRGITDSVPRMGDGIVYCELNLNSVIQVSHLKVDEGSGDFLLDDGSGVLQRERSFATVCLR